MKRNDTMKRTLALIALLFAQTALAQIPHGISSQGVLEDADGNPLTGAHSLSFKIYDLETGGTPLWSLDFPSVEVANGVFSVELKGGTPDLSTLPFDKPYWVGVSVDDGPEMAPRSPLGASAYSLNAARVAPGAAVGSLNGLKDDVVLEAGDNVTITPEGNTLKISATAGATTTQASGTGVVNFIPRWVDSSSLTSSSIFETDDGIIAIGTDAPHSDAKFQIGSSSNTGRDAFIVAEDGQVAIGTTAPDSDARFQVGSSSNTGRDAFIVEEDGQVAIGTTAPASGAKFQVGSSSSSGSKAFVVKQTSNTMSVGIGTTSPNSKVKLHVKGDVYIEGKLFFKTAGDAGDIPSDLRLKKNIATIADALDKVHALRGVSFDWRSAEMGTEQEIGFIAQEVEPVLPGLVSTNLDGYKTVQYAQVVSVLVEAMKQMDGQIQTLNARIAELERGR